MESLRQQAECERASLPRYFVHFSSIDEMVTLLVAGCGATSIMVCRPLVNLTVRAVLAPPDLENDTVPCWTLSTHITAEGLEDDAVDVRLRA